MNAEELATFFGLTKQRVHQLVAEGMPRELRGKYDFHKCARWYIHFLQHALERKAIPLEGGELASEQHERVRKLRLDADMKEIALARERGQLVAIEDVEKKMTDLVLTTKARIMAVPARLAPDMLGESSRVMAQAKIEKALKESLTHLARKPERRGHMEKPRTFAKLCEEWETQHYGGDFASLLDDLLQEWEEYLRDDEVHDFVVGTIFGIVNPPVRR